MRKCNLFLTLIFLCLSQNLSAESKYSVSSVSAKYSVSALTLKTAWKIPQTEFSETPDFYSPAWAFCVDFSEFYNEERNFLPFSMILGTVTPSGAISKLKNPALSKSTNAILNSFSDTTMVYVPLPGSSNCEKPLGLGTSLKFKSDSFLQKINITFYSNENNDFLESTAIQLKTGRKSHFSFSSTSGQFVKSNTTTKWFSATKLFPETEFFATNFQTAFASPYFKTKETVNLFYEKNFFDFPQATFSSENQLKIKDFLLNIAFFCASEKELFTASSVRQKTLCQIKINPMLTTFPFGNKLKTQFGAMYILEQKIQNDESIEIEKKLAGQINFYTKRTFSKLNVVAEGIDSTEKISGSFSHYFYNFLTPTEIFYFSFSPDDDKTKLKYTQKISLRKKNYSISLASSATSYISKNELENVSAEIKMSCQAKTKRLSVSASAGLFFNIF